MAIQAMQEGRSMGLVGPRPVQVGEYRAQASFDRLQQSDGIGFIGRHAQQVEEVGRTIAGANVKPVGIWIKRHIVRPRG